MQIHGPSDEADGSTFTAHLNPGTIEPFAVVQMGHVHFYAHTPEECDAAIRVWTEAKALLLGAAPASEVLPPRAVQMAEFAEIIGGRNPYEQPAQGDGGAK